MKAYRIECWRDGRGQDRKGRMPDLHATIPSRITARTAIMFISSLEGLVSLGTWAIRHNGLLDVEVAIVETDDG